jgi:D-alanyl-lipoteichoic acid acyltransferase DltB (MBOAT superfamily)
VLFNTTEFAVFFAVVLALYLLLAGKVRWQNGLLLVASYVFYGWWDWRFLGLLWLSTLIDYVVAIRIHESADPRRRKRLITFSVCCQLGILAFFKYAGFFVESARAALAAVGVSVPPLALAIVLPVGVSFYTFQSMSYTIDVYRGVIPAERRLLEFACFVSLFPQLVAGPIERAKELLPQVGAPRRVTLSAVYEGSWLVLWGLYKKVFIADNVAQIVNASFARTGSLTRGEAIVALYAFAFQIYGDFSGYTDIARGTAKILGFDFMLNFARPYLADSPSDFWRRWHISLSSWLRDYLYISLGGNRRGPLITYRNLILTMLIGGLWHGAAWTFVLWGAYHGVLLAAHRALEPWIAAVRPRRASFAPLWRGASVLVMFHLVVLGWLPFRARSMREVADVLRALVRGSGGAASQALTQGRAILLFTALLVIFELAEERWPGLVFRLPFWARGILYFVITLSILVAGAPGGQTFIYFQF